MTNDSLLGGGYLRLPASLTVVVVTLRALCQEREEVGLSRFARVTKKREATSLLTSPLLGGGYLRLPASLAIVVVTLRALCQERDEMAG